MNFARNSFIVDFSSTKDWKTRISATTKEYGKSIYVTVFVHSYKLVARNTFLSLLLHRFFYHLLFSSSSRFYGLTSRVMAKRRDRCGKESKNREKEGCTQCFRSVALFPFSCLSQSFQPQFSLEYFTSEHGNAFSWSKKQRRSWRIEWQKVLLTRKLHRSLDSTVSILRDTRIPGSVEILRSFSPDVSSF